MDEEIIRVLGIINKKITPKIIEITEKPLRTHMRHLIWVDEVLMANYNEYDATVWLYGFLNAVKLRGKEAEQG